MRVGNIDINAAWVASKTEAEVIEHYLKAWGETKEEKTDGKVTRAAIPAQPVFRKRTPEQRIEYIKEIYKLAKGETGTKEVKPEVKQNKPAAEK